MAKRTGPGQNRVDSLKFTEGDFVGADVDRYKRIVVAVGNTILAPLIEQQIVRAGSVPTTFAPDRTEVPSLVNKTNE